MQLDLFFERDNSGREVSERVNGCSCWWLGVQVGIEAVGEEMAVGNRGERGFIDGNDVIVDGCSIIAH